MHSHGPAVPQGNGNLVLSRRPGETIMIGDDIVICLVDIRGDNVRIAVSAPRNLSIHRREVYDEIKGRK